MEYLVGQLLAPGLVVAPTDLFMQLKDAQLQISDLQKEVQKWKENSATLERICTESGKMREESNRLNDTLKKIIERIEWRNYGPDGQHCPWCGWKKENGHAEGCDLGHALHGAFPISAQIPEKDGGGREFGGVCEVCDKQIGVSCQCLKRVDGCQKCGGDHLPHFSCQERIANEG